MKFFKNLILTGALLLAGVIQLDAAQTAFTFTGAQTNSIAVGSATIQKIEVANATAGTATLDIYDAPAAITSSLTYSVGAYTNFNVATVNVTNTWTDIFGSSQSEVITKIQRTETVTPASTPTYRKVRTTISIPANSTTTITFPNLTIVGFGIGGVSSTNLTGTVYYVAN